MLPIAFVTPEIIKYVDERKSHMFVTLWCASPHNRLYEQLITPFDALHKSKLAIVV